MKPGRPEFADFAERLRQAREKAGFHGVREAAREFNWNENTYKSRENAIRGIPEYADVRKYARAFKVPFVWVPSGEGEGPAWAPPSQPSEATPLIESDELPPVRMHELQDSDCIQVSIGDLRTFSIDALRRGKVAENRRLALANTLIACLQERASQPFVLRSVSRVRIDAGSHKPNSDDPA